MAAADKLIIVRAVKKNSSTDRPHGRGRRNPNPPFEKGVEFRYIEPTPQDADHSAAEKELEILYELVRPRVVCTNVKEKTKQKHMYLLALCLVHFRGITLHTLN